MSEKQKVYLLAVMVAIAAVVAYIRFFRDDGQAMTGQPSSAEAGVQIPAILNPAITPPAGSPSSTAISGANISRNLFAPSGPLPDARPGQQPAAMRQPVEELKLSGTVIGGKVAMAIINNRFMQQGQMLGDYRIQHIAPDSVLLVSGQNRRVLEVMALEEAVQ